MSGANCEIEDTNKLEIQQTLTTIFRQVVIEKSWKAHKQALLDNFIQRPFMRDNLKKRERTQELSAKAEEMLSDPNSGPNAFIDSLLDIMLKILVIPPSQQKSADQLIEVFCKVYGVIVSMTQEKFSKPIDVEAQNVLENEEPTGVERFVHKLFQVHMETAFKLTQQKQKFGIQRAFQWLASIVEAFPAEIWHQVKKRIIKSIFTHAVYNAITEPPNTSSGAAVIMQSDKLRMNAMKIAGKFQQISILKKYSDYTMTIRSHLLKVMMEDPKDKFRVTAVKQVHLGKLGHESDAMFLKFFVRKT